MINHARTLLVNLVPDDVFLHGEEYISDCYTPRLLTPLLSEMYKIIFDRAESRCEINSRARQLMPILHSAELEPYVYALDSRVTYLPSFEYKFNTHKGMRNLADMYKELACFTDKHSYKLFDTYTDVTLDQLANHNETLLGVYKLGVAVLVFIYNVNALDRSN